MSCVGSLDVNAFYVYSLANYTQLMPVFVVLTLN